MTASRIGRGHCAFATNLTTSQVTGSLCYGTYTTGSARRPNFDDISIP